MHCRPRSPYPYRIRAGGKVQVERKAWVLGTELGTEVPCRWQGRERTRCDGGRHYKDVQLKWCRGKNEGCVGHRRTKVEEEVEMGKIKELRNS